MLRAQPFGFEFVSQQVRGVSFSDVEWIDVNRDGLLDLALAGNTASLDVPLPYAGILRLDAFGVETFPGGRVIPFVTLSENVLDGQADRRWHAAMAWGDFDLDGDPDMILAGVTDREMRLISSTLYRNEGSGQFELVDAPVEPTFGGTTVVADFDGDGDEDLLTTGITLDGDRTARIHLNRGDATFETGQELPGLAHGGAAAGDLDGDGDMDVVVTGETSAGTATTMLFRNDGGLFRIVPTPMRDVLFGSVALGDYDADGDLDVALCGAEPGTFFLDPVTRLYRNDSMTFTEVAVDIDPVLACDLTWGDFDHDGLQDLAVAGSTDLLARRGVTALYRNEGEGVFSRAAAFPPMYPVRVVAGDYDGDADLDLMLAGLSRSDGPRTMLYQNGFPAINTPPGSPADLSETVDGVHVRLAWSDASDEQSPERALSYNVAVWRSSDGSFVVSPAASLDTGLRFRAAPGNAQYNRTLRLGPLEPGDYLWSVQAIDASYAGSEFAEASTFRIESSDKSTAVSEDGRGCESGLGRFHPNPSSGESRAEMCISQPSRARVTIYDAAGRRVGVAYDGAAPAGRSVVTWDGRSSDGRRVPAGVYFLVMESGRFGRSLRAVVRL